MTSPFPTKADVSVLKTKMVGAYIDIEQANQFALLSVIDGKPRTDMLKKIISEYLESKPSFDELVEALADKAVKSWEIRYTERKGKQSWKGATQVQNRFDVFISNAENDLKRHRIDKEVIGKIITIIRERVKL